MKRFLIAFIVLLIMVVMIYHHTHAVSQKSKFNIVSVTASPVIRKDVTLNLSEIGQVEAYSTVNIKSQVSGTLLKKGFKEGDQVKAGQVLFYIDPAPFRIQLQQEQAKLASDLAELQNAEQNLTRSQQLIKKAYISQQDYDQTLTNTQSARAQVKVDEAAVKNAELQLSYATITSPITGKTGDVQVDPGDLIKANDDTALVTINQMQPIGVVFSLPEQYLPTLQNYLAKHGKIPVDVYVNKQKLEESGYLTFIDNNVNSTTGTIQLKATFSNKALKLWPGQFVTISLPIQDFKNALLVPTRAIQIGPESSYVFVIGAKDTVDLRKIVTGPAIEQDTIIKSGLSIGEHVVTTGQLRLNQGSKVKVISQSTRQNDQTAKLNSH